MGGGGGIDQWRSSAGLATELDLAAVAAHYAQQLERAGWTRRDGDEGGGVLAWSAWDFVDEDGELWQGMLFIVLRRPQAPGVPQGPEGLGVLREYLLEVRLMGVGGELNDFLFS
jgi:hypothetical protein